jgi:hypothetical protein
MQQTSGMRQPWASRSVVVAISIAAIACNENKPKDVPPPSPGTPTSATSSSDAAPPPVDATRSQADDPVGPEAARCTGRWIARLGADAIDECSEEAFAPFAEVDVVLAAGPDGWSAKLDKPTDMSVTYASVTWDFVEPRCFATIVAKRGDTELRINLLRRRDRVSWEPVGDTVSSDLKRIVDGERCRAAGSGTVQRFVPDLGGLPPIEPKRVAVRGAYQLTAEIPAGYKCAVIPPKNLSFEIVVNRLDGDALEAKGMPWRDADVHLNPNELIVTAFSEDEMSKMELRLTIDGSTVTGTLDHERLDEHEEPLCESLDNVKVTGTRDRGASSQAGR